MASNSAPTGGSYVSSYAIEVVDKYSKQLEDFNKSMQGVEKTVEKVAKAVEQKLSLKNIGNSFDKMGTTMVGWSKKLALAFLPITAFSAGALKAAASYQSLESSLKIFAGSAEVSKQILKELDDISSKSIFDLKSYAEASRLLLQAGTSTKAVVEETRRLADLGAVYHIPVEALAQMVNYNKQLPASNARVFNSLAKEGIPVYRELAKHIERVTKKKFSDVQVKKLLASGRISNKALQEIFKSMTNKGGIAYKGMAERTNNLEGSFLRLKNSIYSVTTSFGLALDKSGGVTANLNRVADGIDRLKVHFEGFAKTHPEVIKSVGKIITIMTGLPIVLFLVGTAFKVLATIIRTNPLVAGLTAVVALIQFILDNKEKVSQLVNTLFNSPGYSAIAADKAQRSEMGLPSFSTLDKEGRGLLSKRFDVGAKQVTNTNNATASMNITVNDNAKAIKSIESTNDGFKKFNLGTNNMTPIMSY